MEISDIFFLKKMFTPQIITVIYWLMLLGCVIGGIGAMFVNFFVGLLVLVFGSIGARVWAEVTTVFFRIDESLVIIRDK